MKERILFLQAIKISDPAERRAYLESACQGDRPLIDRVESLVALSGNLGNFLDPTKESAPVPDSDRAESFASPHAEDPSNETRDWETPSQSPDLSFLGPAPRGGILGTLGHYEVRDVIGQGAFGIVLGGWDPKLQREVAIKVLLPHLAKTSPPRKRFLREARAGAAIRHPNVIQVFAVEEEPIPYMVMERVRGRTLQDCIDDEGPRNTTGL
jgi:hypothetical protein